MDILSKAKNKKREIVFIVFSFVLLIVLIGSVIYAMKFLITKTGVALEEKTNEEGKIPRINFDGLKKIGIMK